MWEISEITINNYCRIIHKRLIISFITQQSNRIHQDQATSPETHFLQLFLIEISITIF